jgi:hypothetical protein
MQHLYKDLWQHATKADKPPMPECRLKDALREAYQRYLSQKKKDELSPNANNLRDTTSQEFSDIFIRAEEIYGDFNLNHSCGNSTIVPDQGVNPILNSHSSLY